jgi:3D-(3,5/4)-trihydroxycyclohexane-1,2-dione acylhydrolase (decyclizing)
MSTTRLTTAQAIIKFLKQQYVERDGKQFQFFAGMFGILGHGNVAGIGQALQENPDFRFYQARNEQAMVHIAAAFSRMSNRLRTFACTSSIGPGATNMVTGAAGATINRLPVLLFPGDIFSRRNVAPVLQQLEVWHSQDSSVNDTLKPVSRYWDRINRPEQAITSLLEAMRVLVSPSETGAVTLALPQDVQAEAYDFPSDLFKRRVWVIPRIRPDKALLQRALAAIKSSKKPLIVAGGGVIYSEAAQTLRRFAEQNGIPVAETMAGKGSLPYNHQLCLGGIGATGTPGANTMAREADLIIGIGTRYSDFTTASKTIFQNPDVHFININIGEFDAFKEAALPLWADARSTLEELMDGLEGFQTDQQYQDKARKFNQEWDQEVNRIFHRGHSPKTSQGEVIGVLNEFVQPRDVILNGAGTLPGDLHKLWRTRDPKGFHVEFGYSCMGYEIAGGLGVKMAAPDREVYVMVGDSSYLMLCAEIVTSIQEGYKLNIILVNNHGTASISGLSESMGCEGFGTDFRYRNDEDGLLSGDYLPVDFAENARSLGACVFRAKTPHELRVALEQAKQQSRTTLIEIETDRDQRIGSYESWWDVPLAEVSESEEVRQAHRDYQEARSKERYYL